MAERTIPIDPRWMAQEQDLVEALTEMIHPKTRFTPFNKWEAMGRTGYKWQLDMGNDWHCSFEGNNIVLHYRYSEEKLAAIVPWVTEYFKPL